MDIVNVVLLKDCDSKGYGGLRGDRPWELYALFNSIQYY